MSVVTAFRLGLVLCLMLFTCRVVSAEESAEPSATAESPAPSPTIDKVVAPDPDALEPLDPWVTRTDEPKEEESAAPEPSQSATPSPSLAYIGEVQTTGGGSKMLPDEREAPLTKNQRKRIEKVEEAQKIRALRYQREIRERAQVDPRGEAEVTICTANLGGYGEKKETKRLLKQEGVKGYSAKERSFRDAVKKIGCDVIAVQGLVGRSVAYAKLGLRGLADKLEKTTGEKWQEYVALSIKELGFNGFLLKQSAIELVTVHTEGELDLPPLSGMERGKFGRALIELMLKVPSRGAGAPRTISLLNFHLQRSISSGKGESEQLRMQMAEVVRELAVRRAKEEVERTPFDPPAYIVLGDTISDTTSPAQLLLDGRVHLQDFYSNGRCKLVPKEITSEAAKGEEKGKVEVKKKGEAGAPLELKAQCGGGSEHLKALFNILTESFPPREEFKQETDKKGVKRWVPQGRVDAFKRELKIRRTYSSAIYLFQMDLPLAWEHQNRAGNYAVGVESLADGKKNSPLVWVKLNW